MKIEVKDLTKSFDDNEVLHGISFSFESGKALGLLGRNGAGKTTSIRILMDVFKADKGTILIDGKPFVPKEHLIGYMPEERGMYPKKKVIDQLLYFGELKGLKKDEIKRNAKALLKKLCISEYENRKLETLSKGNQQKVQLAQTLISDPEIIILDEPFSGLDPVNAQMLKDLIMEKIQLGRMVIFSSHQMSYVEEFCEEIIILNRGNVAISGNLNDIKMELGKHKGIIKANNYSNEELRKICDQELKNYLKVIEAKKEYLIFEMLTTKTEIMQAIVNLNIDISVLGDYKPSLNDIFVWKGGE